MRALLIPLLALSGCFYVTADQRVARGDLDEDGVAWSQDCDPDDGSVGRVSWYADADGDGFGDPGESVKDCAQPEGYVADKTDCDDRSDAVHPGAEELCNGADDDCDGEADDGAQVPTWYVDSDGDGQGDPAQPLSACDQPAGAVSNSDDCDDSTDQVKLGGVELACNGVDDDCDGDVDLADSDIDLVDWTWYLDGDGDGYGVDDGATNAVACTPPSGFVADAGDCDDTSGLFSPGVMESCNGEDDNCDGVTDEPGSTGSTRYYDDLDGDGFGGYTFQDLCTQPLDSSETSGDCDDSLSCVYPGALEVCDGLDNDCDFTPDDGCVPPVPDTADTGGVCP